MTWIEEAKEAIKQSSATSSVYIGSDSIVHYKNGKNFARYSTVIVIHKDSCHGCKIFYNSEVMPDYLNIKQRLLNEVQFAVSAASEIIDVLDGRHLEIHLDINESPRYKSNAAVKEALGWVKGVLGIDAKIKPHSWVASHCADHAARGLFSS